MHQANMGFGNGQSSDMERLFQSRVAAAAAAAGIPSSSLEAALAAAAGGHHHRLTGNETAAMEFLQRLTQQGDSASYGRGAGGYPPHDYRNDQYHGGGR